MTKRGDTVLGDKLTREQYEEAMDALARAIFLASLSPDAQEALAWAEKFHREQEALRLRNQEVGRATRIRWFSALDDEAQKRALLWSDLLKGADDLEQRLVLELLGREQLSKPSVDHLMALLRPHLSAYVKLLHEDYSTGDADGEAL